MGKITILCSGVALGVYIPALRINYQLKQRKLNTEVHVLENLIAGEKKQNINVLKKAFHDNFAIALKGQKIARDMRPHMDNELVKKLIQQWVDDECRQFLVFSGFWLPVIREYEAIIAPRQIHVKLMHIDSDYSPSWKLYKDYIDGYEQVFLFRWDTKELLHQIKVTEAPSISFLERSDRFVIHGGGWGMGTYQNKIPELLERGFQLDVIAYYEEEINHDLSGVRYFLNDPTWSPWVKNKAGEHEYPLFGEAAADCHTIYYNKQPYHALFDLVRQNQAVISKPGGSTLVDSLASGTPLILLEPFGAHEQKNADLWEHHGFGINYQRWKEDGFPTNIFKEMNERLNAAANQLNDYGSEIYATENANQI